MFVIVLVNICERQPSIGVNLNMDNGDAWNAVESPSKQIYYIVDIVIDRWVFAL